MIRESCHRWSNGGISAFQDGKSERPEVKRRESEELPSTLTKSAADDLLGINLTTTLPAVSRDSRHVKSQMSSSNTPAKETGCKTKFDPFDDMLDFGSLTRADVASVWKSQPQQSLPSSNALMLATLPPPPSRKTKTAGPAAGGKSSFSRDGSTRSQPVHGSAFSDASSSMLRSSFGMGDGSKTSNRRENLTRASDTKESSTSTNLNGPGVDRYAIFAELVGKESQNEGSKASGWPSEVCSAGNV